MRPKLRVFGAFWYDFLVGDDWLLVAGVVAALLVSWGVARTTDTAWWILPVAVAVLLPASIWRAVRRRRS